MLPPDVRNSIKSMRSEGKTMREISKALNIGKSTVSAILRKDVVSEASEPSPPKLEVTDIITSSNEYLDSMVLEESQETKSANAISEIERDSILNKLLGDGIMNGVKEKEPIYKNEIVQELMNDIPEPPLVPKPVIIVPEPLDKSELIIKISMLVTNYEPLLRDYVKNKEVFLASLRKMSLADLTTTHKILDNTKTIGNASNTMRHIFYMGCSGIELFTTSVMKMKTEGFSVAIRDPGIDTELRMILTEIAAERIESIKKIQRPELRLAFLLSTTLLAIDSKNRALNVSVPNIQVPKDLEVKFSDL